MSVLGLDIGGANLKAVHAGGAVALQPFELWKNPGGLAEALKALLEQVPPADTLAVTMTGELCDCFESKRHGVHAILDAVEVAGRGAPVLIWRTDCRFVDMAAARQEPLLAAASNWLALAVFAGRYAPTGRAVVVDVGSTTTDIIRLQDGKPIPRGRTDLERLRCQELIYTGISRTPLCALLGGAGAAELFATTQDIYLVLGMLPEDPINRATADGRPATRTAAHARLARMVCADLETFGWENAEELARLLMHRQRQLIRNAFLDAGLGNCHEPLPAMVLAGAGEFLARSAIAWQPAIPTSRVISLAEEVGPAISRAACAYALTQLV
jgi:probable H4MPT-linked C1 transfer pathway protein